MLVLLGFPLKYQQKGMFSVFTDGGLCFHLGIQVVRGPGGEQSPGAGEDPAVPGTLLCQGAGKVGQNWGWSWE